MKEDSCYFLKDSLVIKASYRSPLLRRLVVLVLVVICGVYIGSICQQQLSLRAPSQLFNVRVFNRPCNTSGIENSEIPYVHFPNPKTFDREECACNPVRYFAIFSMQRSGSGWFETLLNSHINVSSNGEIFGQRMRRANVSAIERTLDTVYNLDWLSSASKNECNAAVGFKWMLNQGVMEHHQGIVEYFKRNGVHAVFLFRRNLLRRIVSVLANSYDKSVKALNGIHKSHVHSPLEAEILASYKPVLNTTTLLSELTSVSGRAARVIEYFKDTRHIVLYYEDVVQNKTKLKDVQDFLRLPYRELRSSQVKIHTGSLSTQIQNWDVVQHLLEGTEFESFLN